MTPATPRSAVTPRWLTLAALAATLLLALTGALAPADRADAASASISVSAYQGGSYGPVYITASIYTLTHVTDGVCDMQMTKLGRGSIGKVTVYKEDALNPGNPIGPLKCEFKISRQNLTIGSWLISVNYQSDEHNIDITGYDSVSVS